MQCQESILSRCFELYLPQEKYFISKERNSGITYVSVGSSQLPEDNFRLYYDYENSQYTIVQEDRYMGTAYITLDNLQVACACFIFKLSKFLAKYQTTEEETIDEWNKRKLIMANELFDDINKIYGGLKEKDKELVFRFWYIGKELDYVSFDCSRRKGDYQCETIQNKILR